MFNEGYVTSDGADLRRPTSPTRRSASPAWSAGQLPDDPEVAGLLALMLLIEARRPARTPRTASPSRCPIRTARPGITR